MLRVSREELEGAAFGITSGVITTLGVLTGVITATGSELATVAAILTVAIADAVSDAAGIYTAKETEAGVSQKSIWRVTSASFWAKFLSSIIFVIPIILLPQPSAIIVSIVFGFSFLLLLGTIVAQVRKKGTLTSSLEHAVIGLVVVLVTFLLGRFLGKLR